MSSVELAGAPGDRTVVHRFGRVPVIMLFLLVIAALLVVYRATALSMVDVWLNSNTFTHCFIVVPMVIWMIWRERAHLARLDIRPQYSGMILLALAGLIWLVGNLADVQLIQHLALTGMIPALVLTVFGTRITLALTFPLAFLFLAVPAGEFLVPYLMDITAWLAVKGIELVGIPVLWQGYYISVPSGDWLVAEACSGIRFLIAMVVLGSFFAYVSYRSVWKRVLFISLCIVLPVIANGIRAWGIILIGHYSNMQLAVGADHLIYGWLFFAIVMFVLFLIGAQWTDPPVDADTETVAVTEQRADAGMVSILLAAVLGLATVLFVPTLADRLQDSEADGLWSASAAGFAELGPWVATQPAPGRWRPYYAGAQHLAFDYSDNGQVVALRIARYAREGQGAEAVSSMNTVLEPELWRTSVHTTRDITEWVGQSFTVTETVFRQGTGQWIVWHWYDISGHSTHSSILAKLFGVRVRLLGEYRGAAMVAVASQVKPAVADTRLVLGAFTRRYLDRVSLFPE